MNEANKPAKTKRVGTAYAQYMAALFMAAAKPATAPKGK